MVSIHRKASLHYSQFKCMKDWKVLKSNNPRTNTPLVRMHAVWDTSSSCSAAVGSGWGVPVWCRSGRPTGGGRDFPRLLVHTHIPNRTADRALRRGWGRKGEKISGKVTKLKFPCTQIYQHHQTDFEAFEDWAVTGFNCTLFVIIKNGMHCFCHPLFQSLQQEDRVPSMKQNMDCLSSGKGRQGHT